MLLSASVSVIPALCALLAAQEEAPPGTAPTDETQAPPAQAPAAPPPASHTQPLNQPGAAAPPAAVTDDRLTGHLTLEPRGVFIVNVPYNTGTLTPGPFVFYAFPAAVSRSQFFVSPSNTTLGFKLSGLDYKGRALSGGLDVTLRSPAPLAMSNTISPQFYAVYLQLESTQWRLIVGQFPDVVLPFLPDTTNSYPSGYVPGALGFARPQLRADTRFPLSDTTQLLVRASLSQPIQTFALDPESLTVGRQGGVPDLQGRVSFSAGDAPASPWDRPYELGVAAHIGRRRITTVATMVTESFRSWSVEGDLRLRFPTATVLKARLWRGTLVGDYMGAIFQTIDLGTNRAIRAWGGWVEVQQALTPHWKLTVGYGRDNPFNDDLSVGARALNQAGFGNVFWDLSTRIGFAVELARWETTWVGAGVNHVWRADVVFLLRF